MLSQQKPKINNTMDFLLEEKDANQNPQIISSC
jgi:hypothetical protein